MICPGPEDRHDTREREALLALWDHLARRGDAEAQFRLGLSYCDSGHESDGPVAQRWREQAAAQKHELAQVMLRQLGERLRKSA